MIYIILIFMLFIDCTFQCDKYLEITYIGDSDKPYPSIYIFEDINCTNFKQKKSFQNYNNFVVEKIKIDSLISIMEIDQYNSLKDTKFRNRLFIVKYYNNQSVNVLGYFEPKNMYKFINSFELILKDQTITDKDKDRLENLKLKINF